MNCQEFKKQLDAFIDNELNEADKNQQLAHAKECAQCNRELQAAIRLRELASHMDDGIQVPLATQAAWRKAVRTERARAKRARILKYCYAAAAALVLVVGCTFAFNSDIFKRADSTPEMASTEMVMESSNTDVAPASLVARPADDIIAVDGEEMSTQPTENPLAYDVWKKFACAEYDAACQTVTSVAEEYNGTAEASAVSDEAGMREMSYTVELPGEYLSDFLSAVSRIGSELDSETGSRTGDTAIVILNIREE